MSITDSLRILITANGAQAEREFSKVGAAARRNLGQAETSTVRLGRTLTSAGVAMAAFGGVALAGLYKAAQAAQEEDLQIAKLNNSIANSEALANASADAFLAQAAALQDTTRFADDATIGVQALLGQFNLTQDQILRLTPLVLDLSSKMGISLEAAAKSVGRSSEGTNGALSRMIGSFDVGSNRAEAFAATVDVLRGKVGGFAAEEGETFNGQLAIMRNNLGDVAEGIGRGAVSAFNDLLGPVTAVSDAFGNLDPETQNLIGRVTTFGAVGLTAAGGISFLAGQVLTAIDRFRQLREASSTAIAVLRASGVSGSLGVIGVAAATAAIAFGAFSESSEEVTTDVEGLTRALRQQEAVTGRMSEQWLSDFFASGDDGAQHLLQSLREAGISFTELDRAMALPIERFNQWRVDLERNTDWDVFNTEDINIISQLHADRTAAEDASEAMDELSDTTHAAANETHRLSDEWNGLSGRLDAFNASLDVQDSLFQFRDGLREARKEGGVSNREMLDLNQNLADLVESYQRSAEAQATAADGTVNFQQRNRILRQTLGGLAAFIPAELRPQFQGLTQDVLGMPDHANITVTSNVANVRREFELLVGTINNAGAVAAGHSQEFHNVGVTAPTVVPRSAGSRPNGSAGTSADEIADRIADRLSRTVQPMVLVNGAG